MENINIEDIMTEIKENIKTKGYSKKELKFADIEIRDPQGMGTTFDMGIFKNDLHSSFQTRLVASYRPIESYTPGVGIVVKFVKKVLRKLLCFYIEPIVEDQNKFNENIVRNMTEICTKFDNDAKTIEDLEKRIDELETKCRKLEFLVKEN